MSGCKHERPKCFATYKNHWHMHVSDICFCRETAIFVSTLSWSRFYFIKYCFSDGGMPTTGSVIRVACYIGICSSLLFHSLHMHISFSMATQSSRIICLIIKRKFAGRFSLVILGHFLGLRRKPRRFWPCALFLSISLGKLMKNSQQCTTWVLNGPVIKANLQWYK